MVNKFLNDITTGKDNKTHDVVRVSMAVIVSMLPLVLIWAMVLETISFYTGKPFDMRGVFVAIMEFLGGAASFLVGGAASLLIKDKTEPDGTKVEETQITKSTNADNTEVTNVTSTTSSPVQSPQNAP